VGAEGPVEKPCFRESLRSNVFFISFAAIDLGLRGKACNKWIDSNVGSLCEQEEVYVEASVKVWPRRKRFNLIRIQRIGYIICR